MTRKNIFITGGAGFIGSHVNKMLDDAGYNTIVYDNLSRGSKSAVTRGTFIEGDLSDKTHLNKIFAENKIDVVMHFAAYIDVGESALKPAKYYQNNVVNTLNLLNVMLKHSVKTIIFSSTAALFGIPQELPIKETHPLNPINPYGWTKFIVEQILQDYDRAYNFRYCSLRYFNAAGADPDNEIKYINRKESNLIPIILNNIIKKKTITIFGTDYPTHDGTCIRDYVHIMDIGLAHILSMQHLLEGGSSQNYNIGNGKGFSVKEVIQAVEKATGQKIPTIEGPRRPGDPDTLYADSSLVQKELGWRPSYPSLDQIVSHAWNARKNSDVYSNNFKNQDLSAPTPLD